MISLDNLELFLEKDIKDISMNNTYFKKIFMNQVLIMKFVITQVFHTMIIVNILCLYEFHKIVSDKSLNKLYTKGSSDVSLRGIHSPL